MSPRACPVPQDALLQRYVGQGATYTDCYTGTVECAVTLPDFVTAFYTSRLFRAERLVLGHLQRKRIQDADIAELLNGNADHFAVWTVEARSSDAMLLCDVSGHTRSWFAVEAVSGNHTKLFFGSAVVARDDAPLPVLARMSLPFHRRYARALLVGAVRNLAVPLY